MIGIWVNRLTIAVPRKLMTTVADKNARIRAQRTRSRPETTRTQINLLGSTAVELELHVMPFHSLYCAAKHRHPNQ